jgi:hypothetical protein
MEFVSRWRLLNYDPNSLKVAKLTSEAKACHREAWAGAKRGQLAFGPLWGHPGVGGGAPVVRIMILLYNPLVSRRNRSQRSCKYFTKIVKVVINWCPWFFPSLWRVFYVKILVSM